MSRQERQKLKRAVLLGAGGGLAGAIPFASAYPALQIVLAVVGPVLLAMGGAIAAGEFNEKGPPAP